MHKNIGAYPHPCACVYRCDASKIHRDRVEQVAVVDVADLTWYY